MRRARFYPYRATQIPPGPCLFARARRFHGPILGALLGLCYLALPVRAAIVINNVTNANITPSSFSIVGAVSPASAARNYSISVFGDSAGSVSLTGQVGIEYYPLNSGDPLLTNSYARLLNRAALRKQTASQGLLYARISGCNPSTAYYYRVQVTDTNAQTTVWPASGPLPAVTTATQTSFVVDSEQIVVTVDDRNATGSIITLSSTNGTGVLAAVVGDGAATNQAFFNLNDLLALNGGTNFAPVGTQQFAAQVLGPGAGSLSQRFVLNFSPGFVVAQQSQLTLIQLLTALKIGSTAALAGTSGSLPLNLSSAVGVSGLRLVLNLPTALFSNLSVQSTTPLLNVVSLKVLDPGSVQIDFASPPGQSFVGDAPVAMFDFDLQTNLDSAFVHLWPAAFYATNSEGLSSNTLAHAGRIVVIGSQPLLDSAVSNSVRSLTLYGIPGNSYQLQYATALVNSNNWTSWVRVPLTNLAANIPNVSTSPLVFYRAYQFTATQPILESQTSAPGTHSLVLYGTPGSAYQVQYSTDLTSPWHVLALLPLTNSFAFLSAPAAQNSFYRANLLRADPPLLQPSLSGTNRSLLAFGLPRTNYTILYKTNLTAAWQPLFSYTLSNSFQWFSLAGTNAEVFYRLRRN